MTTSDLTNEGDERCPACIQNMPLGGYDICLSCSLQLMHLGLQAHTALPQISDQRADEASTSEDWLVREGVISKFDDYELVQEIARGGMGVVYLARQLSLQRNVAVKLILAGQLATPELVQRFRREAEAAARLQHPGIVQIYEIGEFESQHYYSMEYIEGASLAQCMSEFALRTTDSRTERKEKELAIAEIMMKVARAIDYAHQRGVLHRDIKPSNILLDENGQPHLTDFGLARLPDSDTSSLTSIHAVMGTPGYLAPEQVEGHATRVTTTTDVYGIGATLYELLTGQPPFVGSTAIETMWMAAKEDVKAPRSLTPSVSRDLETIALRCLEKKPEQRYQSALVVADELQRFLRHEPIQARRIAYLELAWRVAKRYPRIAAILVVSVLALLLGTTISAWQWSRAERFNKTLTESIEHLEWNLIDDLIAQGESSRALATVALQLRDSPANGKAAMFAMSMLEQKAFPLPVAPTIRHSSKMNFNVARLSRDGKLIVTACMDGTAQLWDAHNSIPIGAPLQHASPVTWAEFHPSGDTVATCSQDGVTQLWNVSTSLPVADPFRLPEAIKRVEFSQDGEFLLVQSNSTLGVLDGVTGRPLFAPLIHSGTIVNARVLPDSRSFFCAVKDKTETRLTVRETKNGTETASVDLGNIRHADITNDLKYIVVVTAQGSAWVSDFPEMKQKQSVDSPNLDLRLAAFDVTGELFYTVSMNQWTRVWSTKTALPVSNRLPHYYLINGAAFTKSSKQLLTWSDDALVNYWDLERGGTVCEPLRHTSRVVYAEHGLCQSQDVVLTTMAHRSFDGTALPSGSAQLWTIRLPQAQNIKSLGLDPNTFDTVCFSPDGKYLLVAKTSQQFWLHDAVTGDVVSGPFSVGGSVWGALFSADGKKLIVTTANGKVSFIAVPDGRPLQDAIELPQSLQAVEMTADQRHFATASTDGSVRLWDTERFKLLREMSQGSALNSLAFSPDGRQLASAGENKIVRIWDTATGNLIRELTGHTNEVMKVAYSPDGRTIVTTSLDFSAMLWDAATGNLLYRLPHQGEVLDAAFRSDGRLVATCARDRTAVLWDLKTGKPTCASLLHTQGVRNVVFHPYGPELLTCSFDGLRLWDSQTGNPLTVSIPQQLAAGTGFQSSSTRGAFSPDGAAVARGTDAYEAILWRFSEPNEPAPAWFIDLLEAVAGQRMSAQNRRPETVSTEVFLDIKRRILASDDTDYYTLWAKRWLE